MNLPTIKIGCSRMGIPSEIAGSFREKNILSDTPLVDVTKCTGPAGMGETRFEYLLFALVALTCSQ